MLQRKHKPSENIDNRTIEHYKWNFLLRKKGFFSGFSFGYLCVVVEVRPKDV